MAERGKIGITHSSSECSSNSSVESNTQLIGLINHERKGELKFDVKIHFHHFAFNLVKIGLRYSK